MLGKHYTKLYPLAFLRNGISAYKSSLLWDSRHSPGWLHGNPPALSLLSVGTEGATTSGHRSENSVLLRTPEDIQEHPWSSLSALSLPPPTPLTPSFMTTKTTKNPLPNIAKVPGSKFYPAPPPFEKSQSLGPPLKSLCLSP